MEYDSLKLALTEEINCYYQEKNKSVQKKLRDERLKFVKQPTKILIESIVRKQKANDLNKYLSTDNVTSTDSTFILNDINKYYVGLLGEEKISKVDMEKYVFSMEKKSHVSEKLFPDINKKITFFEAYEVIMNMEESAPGSNGLTINFFKKFFPYFGEHFIEILNDDEGILPETFNESIIKLIPKNDNNVKGINDLRPLSLTNFEYRIYTKILVNRFNKLGPMLFSDCQTCSVKGRRINDSINTIKDIIEDANIKNNEAFLTSIDQRKAFDSFSHLYLFYLLDYLNISENLIALYVRIESLFI